MGMSSVRLFLVHVPNLFSSYIGRSEVPDGTNVTYNNNIYIYVIFFRAGDISNNYIYIYIIAL